MTTTYQQILEDVTRDSQSGAWVIARKSINCIDALVQELSSSTTEKLVAEVERVCALILKAQPAMAQLTNFFNTIWLTIEEESSGDVVVLARKLRGEARLFGEQSGNAVARVAEHGATLIENDAQVLIHSNSSTIMEIIKAAHGQSKTFEVLLSESRPVLEGRACANELARLGISSTYFIDAAISKGVDRADLVLLGADSVSERSLINKIGSRAICLLARENVVACYAACESSKFISRRLGPKREHPRNPTEVWDDPPEETTIENYYFDEVSLELFTGVVTEDGILTPDEISNSIGSQKMSPKLLEMLK